MYLKKKVSYSLSDLKSSTKLNLINYKEIEDEEKRRIKKKKTKRDLFFSRKLIFSKSIIIFYLFLFIFTNEFTNVYLLEFNDQHAFIGRPFLKKFSINNEIDERFFIKLTDLNNEKINVNEWLFIERANNSEHVFYLIALPTNEQKGMHFINVQYRIKNSQQEISDVFLLDVYETSFISGSDNEKDEEEKEKLVADDEKRKSTQQLQQQQHCQLKLKSTFTDVKQVWRTIKRILPKQLNNLENGVDNKVIEKWLLNNMIVNTIKIKSFNNNVNKNEKQMKLLQLTINVKHCDRNYLQQMMTKLEKNSLNYDLITINNDNNNNGRDYVNNGFGSSSSDGDDDYNSRKFKREVNIEPSIAINEQILKTISPGENEIEHGHHQLSRVVPNEMLESLSTPAMTVIDASSVLNKHHRASRYTTFAYKTPDLFPDRPTEIYLASTIAYKPLTSNVLTTDLLSMDNELIKSSMFDILPTPTFKHDQSGSTKFDGMTTTTTITIVTEPLVGETTTIESTTTKVAAENLSTTLETTVETDLNGTTTTLSTTTEETTEQSDTTTAAITTTEVTAASSTIPALTTTATTDDTTTTTTSSTEMTTTIKQRPSTEEAATPNRPPEIKRRIQHLKMIAGYYWKYLISEDTFIDFEDGNTRDLQLDLRLIGKKFTSKSVTNESWIYLNKEKQYLYAIPTDNNFGKLRYILVAADSDGAEIYENLTFRIQQHQSSRNFNHLFTLNGVKWSANAYPIRLDAITELFIRIAQLLNENVNLEAFNFGLINGDGENATIQWTMTSMPFDTCNKTVLAKKFEKLTSEQTYMNNAYKPSEQLNELCSPEFTVDSVQLKYLGNCKQYDDDGDDHDNLGPGGDEEKIELTVRNKLGRLSFKYGEIISYKIPDDTFVMPAKRRPELTLLTAEGNKLPEHGYIDFNSTTNTIYGFAMDSSEVNYRNFNLIAKDMRTGATVNNVFVIDFDEESKSDEKYSYEFKASLIPSNNDDDRTMTVAKKVNLLNQIAALFDDKDGSSLKILQFNEYLIKPYVRSGGKRNYGSDGDDNNDNRIKQTNHNKASILEEEEANNDDDENNLERNKRDLSNDHQKKQQQLYYEIVWTNNSIIFLNESKCDVEELQNICEKIFNPDGIEGLRKNFLPDYDLTHIHFRSRGICQHYINEKEIGRALKGTVLARPPSTSSTTTVLPSGSDNNDLSNNIDEKYDAYYMRTIIPAISIIAAMLILSCIIVFILIRYRRKQEKTRFGLTADESRSPDAFISERETFLKKGRSPVIMESELQMSHLHSGNTVIMPPKEDPTASPNFNPARNKNAYQPLRQQRPPPYHK